MIDDTMKLLSRAILDKDNETDCQATQCHYEPQLASSCKAPDAEGEFLS